MSRKPPTISALYLQNDGSLHIEWDLDSFFENPEEPDEVWVELPGGIVSEVMAGGTRKFDVPAVVVEAYMGTVLNGSVVFKWNENPDNVQGSAFSYPLTSGVPGQSGSTPSVPTVKLLERAPKTLQHENLITISWASYSYTRGNIIWGPQNNPRLFTHNIDPHGTVYSGEFTTDRPLAPQATYQFLVQVTNAFHNKTVETPIRVGSVANFSSVRQFLAASGIPTPAGLRGPLHGSHSLRASMGL
ncbi:hypothetical protein ABZW18_31465 [Streptomyces sp. NPDC004647]|uniref:hypothetical protein n=1 Tax=Streptomyces sp. NPDC004647 TaxID=3154671 RepID=UPI0033A00C0E